MIKRFDGANWVDVSSVRRFNGSNWQDCNSVKRFDGSNWVETMHELDLYNFGNYCIPITGGWNRTTNFWYPYTTTSSQSYLKYNANNIEIKSCNWNNYKVPMTSKAIDLSNYNKLNLLFDFYFYESATFDNGLNFGVSSTVPEYIYRNNPITVVCDGYDYRQHEQYRIYYTYSNQWFYDQSLSLNISTCRGTYFPWIAPISWAQYSDYTIVKVKRIWLSN